MMIELESKSIQFLIKSFTATFFSLLLQKYFFLYVVYASNDHIVRRELWADLQVVSSLSSHVPWIVLGDFNVTLHMNERSDFFLRHGTFH